MSFAFDQRACQLRYQCSNASVIEMRIKNSGDYRFGSRRFVDEARFSFDHRETSFNESGYRSVISGNLAGDQMNNYLPSRIQEGESVRRVQRLNEQCHFAK